MYTHTHIYIYTIYTYVYVRIYIYIYMYIYKSPTILFGDFWINSPGAPIGADIAAAERVLVRRQEHLWGSGNQARPEVRPR